MLWNKRIELLEKKMIDLEADKIILIAAINQLNLELHGEELVINKENIKASHDEKFGKK